MMIQLNLTTIVITITIQLSRMGLLVKTCPIQIDFYKIIEVGLLIGLLFIITWLVVWNMKFIFPFSWECHHPN